MGVALVLVIFACQVNDSSQKSSMPSNDGRLAGTWRQVTLNAEDVSDRDVKLIITQRTLTMAAPGCQISGEYVTADDLINFTITAAIGDHCAKGQDISKSESARYQVTDSQLTLTQRSGGLKTRTIFQRADGEQQS
jgi:hypothetical protein